MEPQTDGEGVPPVPSTEGWAFDFLNTEPMDSRIEKRWDQVAVIGYETACRRNTPAFCREMQRGLPHKHRWKAWRAMVAVKQRAELKAQRQRQNALREDDNVHTRADVLSGRTGSSVAYTFSSTTGGANSNNSAVARGDDGYDSTAAISGTAGGGSTVSGTVRTGSSSSVYSELGNMHSSKGCTGEPSSNAESSECAYGELIRIDIPRTFPDLPEFGQDAQEKLYTVLKTYSLRHPEIGYCQGMNFIAGFVLIISNLQVEEASEVFHALMNLYELRGFFQESFPLLSRYVDIFDELCGTHVPKLKKHFNEQGIIAPMYLHQWLLTAFVTSMPLRTVVVIWDNLIATNLTVLLPISVTLLKVLEGYLLLRHFEEAVRFLKSLRDSKRQDEGRIGRHLARQSNKVVLTDDQLKRMLKLDLDALTKELRERDKNNESTAAVGKLRNADKSRLLSVISGVVSHPLFKLTHDYWNSVSVWGEDESWPLDNAYADGAKNNNDTGEDTAGNKQQRQQVRRGATHLTNPKLSNTRRDSNSTHSDSSHNGTTDTNSVMRESTTTLYSGDDFVPAAGTESNNVTMTTSRGRGRGRKIKGSLTGMPVIRRRYAGGFQPIVEQASSSGGGDAVVWPPTTGPSVSSSTSIGFKTTFAGGRSDSAGGYPAAQGIYGSGASSRYNTVQQSPASLSSTSSADSGGDISIYAKQNNYIGGAGGINYFGFSSPPNHQSSTTTAAARHTSSSSTPTSDSYHRAPFFSSPPYGSGRPVEYSNSAHASFSNDSAHASFSNDSAHASFSNDSAHASFSNDTTASSSGAGRRYDSSDGHAAFHSPESPNFNRGMNNTSQHSLHNKLRAGGSSTGGASKYVEHESEFPPYPARGANMSSYTHEHNSQLPQPLQHPYHSHNRYEPPQQQHHHHDHQRYQDSTGVLFASVYAANHSTSDDQRNFNQKRRYDQQLYDNLNRTGVASTINALLSPVPQRGHSVSPSPSVRGPLEAVSEDQQPQWQSVSPLHFESNVRRDDTGTDGRVGVSSRTVGGCTGSTQDLLFLDDANDDQQQQRDLLTE